VDVHIKPSIHQGDSFELVKYPDDDILLRVTSSGNVQVIEYHSTDREGPPPHHHLWNEVEYVIEGNVEFWLKGEWIACGPGSVQMLPAGEAHSIRVPAGTAKLLMLTIGAPFDAFSRELGEMYASGNATLDKVVEIASRHGLGLA
jgi:quercetin dioxygenase-like cupin family protein